MAVLMSDSIPATSFGVRGKKLAGFNILTFLQTIGSNFHFLKGPFGNTLTAIKIFILMPII